MEVSPVECGHNNLDDKNIINLDIIYHTHTNMSPTVESTADLESKVETKYGIHEYEYIDVKKIKEEPVDYQQSQIKIENLVLDESPNDVPQEYNTDDIYSGENNLENKNLDNFQIKCCENEYDEVTDIKSNGMVIRNSDVEDPIYKKDQSSNLIFLKEHFSHESTQLSILKPQINIKEKSHKCEFCDYATPRISDLKRHINSIHTREKIHKCQYCDYESPRMSNLKSHINSSHTREKIHRCVYCDYESPRMSNLKSHIKSLHTLREKIHKCRYCDYGSAEKSTLKRHINSMHTREKIHKCVYCDYGSPEMSNLKSHINSKHTREKVHKCEYCDYESSRIAYLKSHIKSIHTREKMHQCVYCDYESPHALTLKCHIKCKHAEVGREDI